MATKNLAPQAYFDLGHQGDLDYTQIAKSLSLTPSQRWGRFVQWRQFLGNTPEMFSLLEDVIRRLNQAQVEYVIVGGVAGVLQGALIDTLDLDLCYRRTTGNLAHLVEALASLKPRPRGFPAELQFTFDVATLSLGCNFTLDIGGADLDLLGEMSSIGGYEQIVGSAISSQVAGMPVKVLSLEQLIITKTAANRPKDHLALVLLRAALEMKKSQDRGDAKPAASP